MADIVYNRPGCVKVEEDIHKSKESERHVMLLNHFNSDSVSKYFQTRCEREFGWLRDASVVVSISPTYGLMPT